MTDQQQVRTWLDGYRRAWESNIEDEIRALFTDDAVYRDAPWDEARTGADAIVDNWLEHRDQPGDTTFEVGDVHVVGDVAFVQAVTDYVHDERVYDNLWVVEFASDGRARDFTEWYMKRPPAEPAAAS
jgi:ketosteroid isomerase-like protein